MNRLLAGTNRTMPWPSLQAMLLVAFSLGGCTAGHRITTVPDGTPVEGQAAYYVLPRTVVVVDFPVQKKETLPGTGKAYGKTCHERLKDRIEFILAPKPPNSPATLLDALGLRVAPDLNKPSYSVTDPITIGSLPEPDPTAVYRVDLSSSWARKQAIELTLGPLGVLEAGTSSVQDRRVELAIASVQAILDVASPILFAVGDTSFEAPADETVDCELPVVRANLCQKSACEIYRARKALAALPDLVSQPGVEGDQARWLEDKHNRTIAEHLGSFFRPKTTTSSIRCALRPPAKVSPPSILNFNKDDGFQTGGGESDCAIPPEFRCSTCTLFSVYTLDATVSPNQYSELLRRVQVDKQHDTSEPQGFYYRVPAVASLQVMYGSKAVVEQDLVVAQLGIVAALPMQRTYQTKYQVTIDPATGALRKLTAESEAVDPATITGLGTAVSGFLTEREEAEAAEKAAKDELTLLERERKILEEKKKIRDLKKELGEVGEP